MIDFLDAMAALVLLLTAAGLLRLLRGPSAADRVMAVQLLGTGGSAVCLLLAVASGTEAIVDIALTLALLAAFAAAILGLKLETGP